MVVLMHDKLEQAQLRSVLDLSSKSSNHCHHCWSVEAEIAEVWKGKLGNVSSLEEQRVEGVVAAVSLVEVALGINQKEEVVHLVEVELDLTVQEDHQHHL